jgi:hypothetical protein
MKKLDYLKTIVPVAVVLFCTLQKGFGFLLILLLPFFLIYLIYNFVRMIRRPDERKRRGIRIAIWSVVLVLAGTVQGYWSAASRNAADTALQEVLAFRERVGTYPSSLAETGLDEQALQSEWKVRYFVQEGKPRLVYPAPVIPLTMYQYDFETQKWRQNAY